MKTFNLVAATLLTALVVGALGCGGKKTPPDMPKLQPTTITIVQEGTPVDGATVQLFKPDDLNYKWIVGGRTDAEGQCVVKTNGEYKGAPEGDFVVVVYKSTVTESETRKNVPQPTDLAEVAEWSAKVAEEERQIDEIDLKYKKVDTTDLTISIKAGKNEQTFDVGEKISIDTTPEQMF